jgi:competence protein ComEA
MGSENCVKLLEPGSVDERSSCRATWLAVAATIAVGAGITTAVASDPQGDSTRLGDVGPEAFNAAGEQATGIVCTECHGWDAIFGGPRQTPGQWDFIVSDMVSRGAKGTPEQLDLIRRYLKWAWGVVWINSATAQDLAAVIGIPEKEAEAVIAWREEHGPFADVESLKEVPGIDPAVIDAQADAMMFN